MELKQTIDMMTSPDFKERFRAEYFQLKIRIDGLSAMLEKYKSGTLEFEPKCSYALLTYQLQSMQLYRVYLEQRAIIEEVSLEQ